MTSRVRFPFKFKGHMHENISISLLLTYMFSNTLHCGILFKTAARVNVTLPFNQIRDKIYEQI